MIPVDELHILKSADELKSIADTAHIDMQRMAIARALNDAANTHSYEITYNGHIYDDIKKELEEKEYTVSPDPLCPDQYTISFRNAV